MQHKRCVYIAGPMRGLPRYNFPSFDAAATRFRDAGWDVINPADLDRAEGFEESQDLPDDFLRDAMQRDLYAICHCQAIALLPGWEKSQGVAVELSLARLLGLEILDAGSMEPMKHHLLPPLELTAGYRNQSPSAGEYDPQKFYPPPMSPTVAEQAEKFRLAADEEELGYPEGEKWRYGSMTDEARAARKARPIVRGVLDYFPQAIAEIAHVSYVANEQHNPGEPMHWAREKSTDHADCIVRHLIDRGKIDSDGLRHTAKAAWRALALLQIEIEAAESPDEFCG